MLIIAIFDIKFKTKQEKIEHIFNILDLERFKAPHILEI